MNGHREHDQGDWQGVLGVILCGGQSRRMGTDKAELSWDGRSLLRRTEETLRQVLPRICFGVARDAAAAPEGGCAIEDLRAEAGPLAGLEAALDAAQPMPQVEWVLLAACDLPGLHAGVLQRLATARALAAPGTGALMFGDAEHPQPLIALYHTRLLPYVRAALDQGERRMTAWMRQPGAPPVAWVESSGLDSGLTNVNTPEQWAAWLAQERSA
ncbi:MAG: molybdenum cofactor guanylyltransferase [Planctomycetota bacterium]